MRHEPPDFEKGLKIGGPVDSTAYVSAITQTEKDRIKQPAPTTNFKNDVPPDFEIQILNG